MHKTGLIMVQKALFALAFWFLDSLTFSWQAQKAFQPKKLLRNMKVQNYQNVSYEPKCAFCACHVLAAVYFFMDEILNFSVVTICVNRFSYVGGFSFIPLTKKEIE